MPDHVVLRNILEWNCAIILSVFTCQTCFYLRISKGCFSISLHVVRWNSLRKFSRWIKRRNLIFLKRFSCTPDRLHVSSGDLWSRLSKERELGIISGWLKTSDNLPLYFESTSWNSPELFIEFICSCICYNWKVSCWVVSWFSLNFCIENSSTCCICALFIFPITCWWLPRSIGASGTWTMHDSARRWRASRRPCWAPGRAVKRRCTRSSEVFSGRCVTCRCAHSGWSLTSSSFPSKCLSMAPDVSRCSARSRSCRGDVWSHPGPQMPWAVPLRFCSDSTLPEVKSWPGSWRSLFSERGSARRCSDAMATGRVGTAVGDFTARRRSAKVRLGKTSVAKWHAFKKRTLFTTRRRTHMSGGGAHGACAPNAPSETHALRRSDVKTSASPQWKKHRYSACTVR